jgi:hypothetical protein
MGVDTYGFETDRLIAEVLDILRLGTDVMYRLAEPGLLYDTDSKTILVNEASLMRVIMLVNRGQKPRKIRLVSDDEFCEIRDKCHLIADGIKLKEESKKEFRWGRNVDKKKEA